MFRVAKCQLSIVRCLPAMIVIHGIAAMNKNPPTHYATRALKERRGNDMQTQMMDRQLKIETSSSRHASDSYLAESRL